MGQNIKSLAAWVCVAIVIGGFYQRQGEALPPQKFGQSRNMLHKGVDFYVQNALKLTYEHLQFQKFSRGRHPRTPANI